VVCWCVGDWVEAGDTLWQWFGCSRVETSGNAGLRVLKMLPLRRACLRSSSLVGLGLVGGVVTSTHPRQTVPRTLQISRL
jgi:hypothetical protein